MTAQTRPNLTSVFEQGDSPQGSDFANLIDSFVALVDTTAQVVVSDLRAANFVTSGKVSAATLSIGTFNATTASAANLLANSLNASTASAATLRGSTLTASTAIFSTATAATGVIDTLSVISSARFAGTITLTSADAITCVTASAANGKLLVADGLSARCAGFLKIFTGTVTAIVPFWRSST